ncbi:histidine phosphatase family protein [Anaerolineae bacterium CFX9]|nr:histidine phosphatase family protein [Anaerolineae bacterium CFX9]
MSLERIIFIRPGETDWNRYGRWQGWVAAPLNAHGREQAQALAKFIRNIGLSALYTSDLRRALETAEILAAHLSRPPIPDRRLRERNIGAWQGLTLDEMRAWYPEEYRAMRADSMNYQIESGESRAQVLRRVQEAFAEIVASEQGETVGILSHTTAIKVLLTQIVPGYDPYAVDIGNTSVTTLHRDAGGDWRLIADNDLSHLEGLPSQSVNEIEEG